MTPDTIETLLKIVLAILALPPAIWAVTMLSRRFQLEKRKVHVEAMDLERERNYLLAFQGWMESLDRPLGYDEEEYTQLRAALHVEETVKLRLWVRRGGEGDDVGWSPRDILGRGEGRFVNDAAHYLSSLKGPAILLGEPGSGKSVTLRYLALEFARRAVRSNSAVPKLPIYLQLGAYDQVLRDGSPERVVSFIQRQLRDVIPGGGDLAEKLPELLTQRRIIILLDSMDEMPARDYLARTKALRDFLIEYGGSNRIILACRKREYSAGFPYTELVIEPFDSQRVQAYLQRNWVLYNKVLSPKTRLERKSDFFALSHPTHDLHEYASNPFSLKLLSSYFFSHDGRLPRTRAELLGGYVRERIARGRERAGNEAWETQYLQALWSTLGFCILRNNLGTYFQPVKALALLGDELSADQSEAFARSIDFALGCGIARREKDQSVRFEHHRLLEFLAACHWDTNPDTVPLNSATLENPWFREMVVLRAGITQTAGRLVDELIDVVEQTYLKRLEEHQSGEDLESVLSRLDYLAMLEIALTSAGERWGDLAAGQHDRLLELVRRTVAKATGLEVVRVIRALAGLPLGVRLPILRALVRGDSSWVVDEVFASVRGENRISMEFNQLVLDYVERHGTMDALVAARQELHNLGTKEILRAISKLRGLSLLKRFSRDIGPPLVVLGFVLIVTEIDEASDDHFMWNSGVAIGVAVLGGLVAGWRNGGKVILAAVIAWLVDPSQDGFIVTVTITALWWIMSLTGIERVVWLRRPRYLVFLAKDSRWDRFVAFTLTAYMGLHALHHLEFVGPHWEEEGISAIQYSLAVLFGMGTEASFMMRLRNRAARVVRDVSNADSAQARSEALQLLSSELMQPWPRGLADKLLDSMVELDLPAEQRISVLKKLLETKRFLVSADLLLTCVDRIDLKRRHEEIAERVAEAGQAAG